MDYSSREDNSMGIPTPTPAPAASLAYNNPNPIRVSAFSKPSSSSSLPSPKGNGSAAHDLLGPHNSPAHLHPPSPADPVPLFAVAGASAATINSGSTPKSATSTTAIKYRECLRNHAVAIGGHVLDGCCEFMPGDADPLKCAACDCHRNFHRKHTEGGGSLDSYYHRRDRITVPLLLPPPHPLTHTATRYKQQQQQQQLGGAFPASPSGVVPGSSAAVAFGGSGSGATTESSSEEQLDHAGGCPPPVVIVSKKRFRTKFTAEQKEKMMGFAERVGWRIQRQDDATVEQFCREVGIRRQVFKVWMHNNKHSIKKQQQQQQQQQHQHIESQQQQQQQLQHQPMAMREEI